jgi:outer membrane lipoprotein-sorting protein
MISGNSPYRLVVVALALWLCGAAGIACAAEPAVGSDWGLEQLMQRLSQVKSAKGKFVERKHMAMLDAPLEFSGTLTYTAPGRIEKYTLLPKPESMVLEQDKLIMENKARNQRRTLVLQDYPVIWAFVESFRSTLAGDLPTLHRFYRTTLDGSENQWRLVLKPIEPKMQTMVSEIRIAGSKNRVRTIEIIETEGNRSVMIITEDAP